MQKRSRFSALYCLFVGFSMVILWAMLLITGQVPEIVDSPLTTIAHISAETLTGLLLILTGFGLWLDRAWGRRLYPVSLGMLFYAVIQAVGYYVDHFSPVMILLFVVLILITAYLIIRLFRNLPRS